MYLITITYTQPLEAVERVLEAHRQYLRDAPLASRIVMTGRRRPATGGLVVLRADRLEDVEAFVQADPYFIENVAAFDIVEFDVAQVASGLELLRGG
jgi:uncharacterized protein YciI